METQCQHLTETQLKVLQNFEELFGETLGTWKTDPVDFQLKDNVKPILLQPYPLPKVHK